MFAGFHREVQADRVTEKAHLNLDVDPESVAQAFRQAPHSDQVRYFGIAVARRSRPLSSFCYSSCPWWKLVTAAGQATLLVSPTHIHK